MERSQQTPIRAAVLGMLTAMTLSTTLGTAVAGHPHAWHGDSSSRAEQSREQSRPDVRSGDSDYPEVLQDLLSRADVPTRGSEGDDDHFGPGAPRYDAIVEAARVVGTQAGVRWRQKKISAQLERVESDLDGLYDFQRKMLEDGQVAPPVIVEARDSYRVVNNREATSSGTTYEIIQPAKMITRSPHWRDYLTQQYEALQDVHNALLPENDQEADVWRENVKAGWEDGVRHANDMLNIQIARLNRDFLGMSRYKALKDQGIVSGPTLAEGKMGIVVEGERVDVDQRIFRLSEDAQFEHEDNWEPQVGEETENPFRRD